MISSFRIALLFASSIPLIASTAARPADLPEVTGRIPGSDGGWDYASVDPETGRLFVAHGDAVAAVDLSRADQVTRLVDAHHAHAVLPIPGRGEILVTDGDSATARFVDLRTGKIRASVAVGEKPDAAVWDARRGRVVVMNARSGNVMMIDPATATVSATVPVAPNLEFAAFDSAGRLYVNIESDNGMAVIDADRATRIRTIALPGCDGPTGLAYASQADRLVAACANHVAAIVDPAAGKLVGTIPVGGGPDAVIADPVRHRLYVPAGLDGTLTVLADRPSGVTAIGTVTTERGARTGAVDTRTGTIYLPTAQLTPPAKPGGRGTPVPGTFHILTLGTIVR